MCSKLFSERHFHVSGTEISVQHRCSIGAARGAGIGCGYYKSAQEAFAGLKEVGITKPDKSKLKPMNRLMSYGRNL